MRHVFNLLILFSVFEMQTLESLNNPKNVAIILSGCGSGDGSEIREAIYALTAFEELGFEVKFFAPKKAQSSVIDHLTGKEASETRNVLTESARIARGAIQPISELDTENFAALVFPGGLGVAKNLSDFATLGQEMSVDVQVSSKILEFHSKKSLLEPSVLRRS